MNKTYEEWVEFIKSILAIFQVYDADSEFIVELAKKCMELQEEQELLQPAVDYCLDHLHEYMYGK